MSEVNLDNSSVIFKDMPARIEAARYHSLAAEEESLPKELKVIARTDENEIMAVELEGYHIYGVQFHPESILTPQGKKILENFLNIK
jgi:anthranilate synthase component 2